MGLRELAEADNRIILNDNTFGFGYPVVLTDPTGVVIPLTGLSNDISQVIDPDTGVAVSGRLATAALNINDIIAAGLTLPVGIADSKIKPWLITFADINGNVNTFKVSKSDPDRAIGMLICTLEFYKIATGDFLEWVVGDYMEWITGEPVELTGFN